MFPIYIYIYIYIVSCSNPSSVELKTVFRRSEKPICAPTRSISLNTVASKTIPISLIDNDGPFSSFRGKDCRALTFFFLSHSSARKSPYAIPPCLSEVVSETILNSFD